MRLIPSLLVAVSLIGVVIACTRLPAPDSTSTATSAPIDAAVDAPIDAPTDAPIDAPIDAAVDAAMYTTGVPECDEYVRVFERLATCDKVGPALDGLRQGLEATKQGWAAWKDMPADQLAAAKRAAAPGCKAGADALRSTAASLGCTI